VLPRAARFEVHPKSAPDGREIGSTVVVLRSDRRRIMLWAEVAPDGSRIYYGRACRAR
jgi:hypothetical protein